jgi:hypothetical protein
MVFNLTKERLKNNFLSNLNYEGYMIYFSAAWANYPEAKKGSLKLIPADHIAEAMSADYEQLKEGIFSEYIPSWGEIISEISRFQEEFNSKN